MGKLDKRIAIAVTIATSVVFPGCAAEDSALDTERAPLAQTTTTRPPLPDGACVARMSRSSPPQGGDETVIVDSHHPNRAVRVAVHYKSKDSNYSGQTDGTGHAEIEFSIGKPTIGHAVVVDVDIDGAEKCQTSFTPVAADG